MPDSTKELLELILTQSIERYVEMKPADAEKAIAQEWPQQIRTLLISFLTKPLATNARHLFVLWFS